MYHILTKEFEKAVRCINNLTSSTATRTYFYRNYWNFSINSLAFWSKSHIISCIIEKYVQCRCTEILIVSHSSYHTCISIVSMPDNIDSINKSQRFGSSRYMTTEKIVAWKLNYEYHWRAQKCSTSTFLVIMKLEKVRVSLSNNCRSLSVSLSCLITST